MMTEADFDLIVQEFRSTARAAAHQLIDDLRVAGIPAVVDINWDVKGHVTDGSEVMVSGGTAAAGDDGAPPPADG